MEDVTWRAIPGVDNYEASSEGQIRSLDRTITDSVGHVYFRPGKVLKPVNKAGYMFVSVKFNDGPRKSTRAHQLVCRAFHGLPPDPRMDVRHLNGDSTDNRPENLAWGTRSQNMHDRVRHGRHPNASKTHCKSGHEFSPENTITVKTGRRCRACVRETSERRRQQCPEKNREYQRLWAQKQRQDPERRERMLEQQRAWRRRQRDGKL